MSQPTDLATFNSLPIPDTSALEDRIRRYVYERVATAARQGAEQALADVTAGMLGPAPQGAATGPQAPAKGATPSPAAKAPGSARKAAKRPRGGKARAVTEEALLGAIREGAATDARGTRVVDLAKALNTSVAMVKSVLQPLRTGGRVKTSGKKQGTRYKLA